MTDCTNSTHGAQLRECPFCGGEASVQTTYGYGVSEAFCLDCGAHTGHPPGGCTEAEAIAAWNARAERTCERVPYKPTGVLVCSECGAGMPKQLDKYCYLNYCPNCGAKVVGEGGGRMSEYIIRVDENDERWHYVERQYTHFFGYPITEEIVRCRDCKFEDEPWNCAAPYCVEPDGFCAWGVRRSE